MKKVNRGKDFEDEIRNACEAVRGVSFDRLPDPMGGYSGVKNICDFSMYHYPDMFYLECKSLYGNTLNYKADISKNQIDGLTKKSKIFRCVAGVVVWFIDYDVTAFVNITDINKHREDGAKSLNITDIIGDNSLPHILLDGVKKRVMFSYFGDSFVRKLHKLADELWKTD